MKSRLSVLGMILIGLLCLSNLRAQYSTEQLNSAIHKVSVFFKDPADGKLKSSVGTGFLWQKKNQVVTSMHLLRTGYSRITVTDINGHRTSAKVLKVYKEMDLMLLEVSNPDASWRAFSDIDVDVASNDQLRAIGYNSSAKFWLEKPITASNTAVGPFIPLQFFIPAIDYQAIKKLGFPSVDKNMLAITGSLLPGYSGSPIFDSKGNIVAIGNGGLENGASGVSWGIPSRYLRALISSREKPQGLNLSKTESLFSSEVVEANVEEAKKYKLDDGYEFVYIKTRKLSELIKTGDDPEKLESLLKLYARFNFNLEDLEFDIYEEVKTSAVFVVPTSLNLKLSVLESGNGLTARDGDYFLAMVPNARKDDSLEEYTAFLQRKGNQEFISANELKTTNSGKIRYVELKEFDKKTSQATAYNYRKQMLINDNSISTLGILDLNDQYETDFIQLAKESSVLALNPKERNLLRFKAIMDINMSLHTISNVKVLKEEKLIRYNWKVNGLSFAIPESIPDSSIVSTSEEFEAEGDHVNLTILPLKSETPLTKERLYQLLNRTIERRANLIRYDPEKTTHSYDLGGLIGVWEFLHYKPNPDYTFVILNLMDPEKPKTRLFVLLHFKNDKFNLANDVLNSLKKYRP